MEKIKAKLEVLKSKLPNKPKLTLPNLPKINFNIRQHLPAIPSLPQVNLPSVPNPFAYLPSVPMPEPV